MTDKFSMIDTPTDEDLLLMMRTGDESAFAEIYRRRSLAVFRFALQFCGSRQMAEDITQDTFIALIKASSGFDPQKGSLASFLYGIAHKLSLKSLRLDMSVPLEEFGEVEESGESDPLSQVTREERIEAVRRAVHSLPPRYREVVILCDLHEMDYTEAARILECSVGTVRSRLHRGRNLLLAKLGLFEEVRCTR
jgi:RNA polymerase sigma-70 factor, ECF subfamily